MRRLVSWLIVMGCFGIAFVSILHGRQSGLPSAIAASAEPASTNNKKKDMPSAATTAPATAALPPTGHAGGAATLPPATSAAVPKAPAARPATPAGQSAGEQIVYTFQNDEQMRAFTNLWQQRQGIVVRMTVLESYWREEQRVMTQINNRLAIDYKLDTTKNYMLDPDRRVLVEREPSSPSPASPASSAPSPAQP